MDFGKEQFDVKAMQGLNLMDTRDVIFKNINKIMYLGNLSSYNDMIFLSTNRNDQLVYDTKRDIVIVLSNVEMPYKILFSSPLFVNKNGQFCSIIPNNNVTNAYLPLIDASRVQLSQLKISRDDMDESENAFWVLSGSVK